MILGFNGELRKIISYGGLIMLNVIETKKADYSYEMFQNFISENGVQVKNLDKMPEIGITRALFENPWATEDEEGDLFIAQGMSLTLAKHPDGTINALNKVSKDYRLVQHHEAIYKSLDYIVENHPEFGIPEISLNFMKNGGLMKCNFIFPQAIELQENDPVKPVVSITNSADLSKRFSLYFGAYRMICSNGMVVPDRRFKGTMIKKLHKMGVLDLEDCIQGLSVGFESFSEKIGLWKIYNEKTISLPEWETIMEGSLLSDNQVKEVLQIPIIGYGDQKLDNLFAGGGRVNAYQAYNAVTQWVTHNTKNEMTAMERGIAVSNAFEAMIARI